MIMEFQQSKFISGFECWLISTHRAQDVQQSYVMNNGISCIEKKKNFPLSYESISSLKNRRFLKKDDVQWNNENILMSKEWRNVTVERTE